MHADIPYERISSFEGKASTLREIIFKETEHRPASATVLIGHSGNQVIAITLEELRELICSLSDKILAKKILPGDTILLASFYSSNELANAILFATFACMGIRIFIPMYPEPGELSSWKLLTEFSAVIIPYNEILQQKGHEREKEVIHSIREICNKENIPLLDSTDDFDINKLLQEVKDGKKNNASITSIPGNIDPTTEAIIFTTSGTTGSSRLVVYNQGAFSISCESWMQDGLFDEAICGNRCFTPLFTHTIGIRHFINALYTGHALCLITVDWFLTRPEEARYLLIQMQPGHIVGGPALFNMLVEFCRQFPELKTALHNCLKTLISIGAPYDNSTAKKIKTALGLDLYNAFGTTETQMVLLNRPGPGKDPSALGIPLKGVSIRLKEYGSEGIFELHIRSAFQSCRIINEPFKDEYFFAGDLVDIDEEGSVLRFVSRKEADYMKDDFGVKIPMPLLREYYALLYEVANHIEWVVLDDRPGLAALIFPKPGNSYSIKQLADWVKSRNELLRSTLQPFEFTHRHLERFCLATGELPLTRKGTISRRSILLIYDELLKALGNPDQFDNNIESIGNENGELLRTFSDPRLAQLLKNLELDVQYHRAEKDFLFYNKNGKEIQVLDLVGGFGTNLFGHNNSFIKDQVIKCIHSGRPALSAQGSVYHYPSLLAKSLNELFSKATGKFFKVQYGNSGTEAMEIALHHAYYEWITSIEKMRDQQVQLYGSVQHIDVTRLWETNLKKLFSSTPAIIVLNNCFHGYSSASRSLLNNKKQRKIFSGLLAPRPLHVNDRNANWKQVIDEFILQERISINIIMKHEGKFITGEQSISSIIGAVIEPVRGEGGIVETSEEVADYLSTQPFPLISDEIQSGLGRTGSIPSYARASYYLLGKALGGGYEKISAVLIHDQHFKSSFPQYYTSTFANGELAACAAHATIEYINQNDTTRRAFEKGRDLKEKLLELKNEFPEIIQSVEGRGLMLGVHFNKLMGTQNTFLRSLYENDLLGYLIAGWLFHNKKVRVLPSLSQPNTLRIEPSIHISQKGMDEFIAALKELCSICREANIYNLLKYLMNDDPYLDKIQLNCSGVFPNELEEPIEGSVKVGFIGNFTSPVNEFALIEPSLVKASATGLRILFNKLQLLLEGKSIRLFSKNLMNGRIHFTFYILPFDTAHLEYIHRWGNKRNYINKIQDTVNKLADEGATHISLGAHTSIISGNGLFLAEPGKVKVLTGNTLTVASCMYHVQKYLARLSHSTGTSLTIAILGAGGNIGTAVTTYIHQSTHAGTKLLLIGNNIKRLEILKKKIKYGEQEIMCTTDHFKLEQADIIISCTSSNDPLVFPYHINQDKKVFIIDIAVPGSVSNEVKAMANVEFCMDASTIILKDDPDFLISTHTPKGKVFCCAGEVMLAALHQVQSPLKGHIDAASIKEMLELGILEQFFKPGIYATPV